MTSQKLGNICRIGFGGGCHWCTEAVFMTVVGVSSVRQGFIKSTRPNDGFSEAVIVNYDTSMVSLVDLIAVHLLTHSSTSQHKMRAKYRSAIYTFDDSQFVECEEQLICIQSTFNQPIVTEILPYDGFKSSKAKYTEYYYSDKNRPFCRTYIEPKIEILREQFARLIDKT